MLGGPQNVESHLALVCLADDLVEFHDAFGHGQPAAALLRLKAQSFPELGARIDNRKSRDGFGGKPRMLDAEQVVEITGHPVGDVCPSGLASPLPVYCDVSLRAHDHVCRRPAKPRPAVRIGVKWCDTAKVPELRRIQESTDSDEQQRQSPVTGR
ncbi:YbaK/EbsC family protein [Mesorhizobium sp. AR02]|uniref:YbaK/EbsC family protein n=1 Tax=Mesorhizobium sp. AR02 TaxID=2865837 RepID=UPI00215FD461|nr:YbaK/EbsC family protein [Mesorhizobium sp. AR02]